MTRNEVGYTVLEALIAFAILSVVLVSLSSAGGTSLRLVDRAARFSTISLLAQSKLDEIAAFRGPLPEREEGTFTGSDIRWRIDTTPIADRQEDKSRLRLQQVRLTLRWPGGLRDSERTFETRHLGTVQP